MSVGVFLEEGSQDDMCVLGWWGDVSAAGETLPDSENGSHEGGI